MCKLTPVASEQGVGAFQQMLHVPGSLFYYKPEYAVFGKWRCVQDMQRSNHVQSACCQSVR